MHKEPLTDEQEKALGDVVLVKRDYFSPIWFIPMVAVLIGAYMLYTGVASSGIEISIQFQSGEGIEAGSTKVMFKGLPVGVVKDITVNEDLQGITVKAKIDKNAASLLKNHSTFWLVQPQISLSGVSGLDALVSGNYIAIQPGGDDSTTEFVALQAAPPLDATTPGLHLRLDADTLNSIAEGTNVYYRKIPVGEVKSFELNEKGDGVHVNVHIKKQFAKLVNKNTRFWNSSGISVSGDFTGIKVQAESMVSIITGGISFETPSAGRGDVAGESSVSGNGDVFRLYADYDSSGLERSSQLADPNHLHVVLQSESLSSITEGSKIYYRKIPVGEVFGYALNSAENGVDIQVRIKKQFAHLVKPETRFWNVSGITVTGGLSGIKVRTESVAAIVAGGIAFQTPSRYEKKSIKSGEIENTPIKDGHSYTLYEDYESADVGLLTIIYFKQANGITEGKTLVKYKGMEVGKVQKVELDRGSYPIKVTVAIDPMVEKTLRKGTEFWLVSPRLALTEVKELDTIVGGNYITMRVGGGEKTRSFYSLDSPPPLKYSSPGLHLVLTASELGSISVGTKLFYRKVSVGAVQDFRLNASGEGVDIFIHVERQFSSLVKESSRFWNASGITVTGGMSGIKVRAESLLSIVAGGITFDGGDTGDKQTAENGDRFNLFTGFDEAHEKGIRVQIAFLTASGLHEGTDIRYKGVTVGKVKRVEFQAGLEKVNITALLYPQATLLAKQGAKFWVVEPRFGLAGTSDLDTLVSGQYISVKAGEGDNQYNFVGLESPPHNLKGINEDALQVSLYTERLGSIKEGVGVYYREIRVGQVTGYELSENADGVIIHLSIRTAYKSLVHVNSKFWNASGFDFDFSLFDGVSFKTDSFESILEGGIAFATPNNSKMGSMAKNGDGFKLYDTVQSTWLKWKPTIDMSSTKTPE